jgi:uncharacterized protein
MQFHTDTELGARQSLLPSGALLCRQVVIARTGEQLYGPTEVPNGDAADDGWVHVERDADEVFDPRSMGSFEGVPVTMQHPNSAVDPSNRSELAIGHAQNVRHDGDYLIVDLVIHDRRGIDAIRSGRWRGLSAGYDAQYAPIGRGRLRQIDIRANHLALLPPDQTPRCGADCMIGDAAPRSQMEDLRQATRERARLQQIAARQMAARVELFWLERRNG